MNRFLLDTHILIWWFYDDPKLSEHYKKIISDAENEIFVSVATIWEIEIKRSIGKLGIDEAYMEAIKADGFTLLSISPPHPLKLKEFPDIHKDPFDRMLAAQALCEKLTLLTEDEHIRKYDVPVA